MFAMIVHQNSKKLNIYNKNKIVYIQENKQNSNNFVYGLDELEFHKKNRETLTIGRGFKLYFDHRKNVNKKIFENNFYGKVIVVDNWMILFYIIMLSYRIKSKVFCQDTYNMQIFYNVFLNENINYSELKQNYIEFNIDNEIKTDFIPLNNKINTLVNSKIKKNKVINEYSEFEQLSFL